MLTTFCCFDHGDDKFNFRIIKLRNYFYSLKYVSKSLCVLASHGNITMSLRGALQTFSYSLSAFVFTSFTGVFLRVALPDPERKAGKAYILSPV